MVGCPEDRCLGWTFTVWVYMSCEGWTGPASLCTYRRDQDFTPNKSGLLVLDTLQFCHPVLALWHAVHLQLWSTYVLCPRYTAWSDVCLQGGPSGLVLSESGVWCAVTAAARSAPAHPQEGSQLLNSGQLPSLPFQVCEGTAGRVVRWRVPFTSRSLNLRHPTLPHCKTAFTFRTISDSEFTSVPALGGQTN
jgi:hypothetical protein